MKNQVLKYIEANPNCSMLDICDGLDIYLTDTHYYLQELRKEKLVKIVWVPPFSVGYQVTEP